MKDVAEMTFEDALRELESVVSQLEGGNVPLEQSIAFYERGALLKKHCEAKLDAAQARIEQITLSEGSATGTQAFDTK